MLLNELIKERNSPHLTNRKFYLLHIRYGRICDIFLVLLVTMCCFTKSRNFILIEQLIIF